jgi:hypothetical protein
MLNLPFLKTKGIRDQKRGLAALFVCNINNQLAPFFDAMLHQMILSEKKSTTGGNMKNLFLVLLLTATVAQAETYQWTDNVGTVHFSDTRNIGLAVPSAESRQHADEKGAVAPKAEDMKEQMLKDEGVMALIRELQNDPEMQALLSDPAIVGAIRAGDIGTLVNSPDFMKLLNNPRVREIEKKMQQGGTR